MQILKNIVHPNFLCVTPLPRYCTRLWDFRMALWNGCCLRIGFTCAALEPNTAKLSFQIAEPGRRAARRDKAVSLQRRVHRAPRGRMGFNVLSL